MDDIELDLLVQIYDVIPEIVREDQLVGVADIRGWHRRWLGNVYAWAGQYRTLNMGKDGFQFASVSQIARLLANVMAMQAGKPELDFSIWDKNKTAYFAAIQSGMSDYGQMKTLVKLGGCPRIESLLR